MIDPLRYVVVSPVKDEERFVEHTLRSMVTQTLKPARWIIVDDGSTDHTPEILDRCAAEHDFIEVLHNPQGKSRQPGAAVIRAFDRGYQAASAYSYDIIVKLDCDLSFDSDYFDRLLSHFAGDPQLGIASGVYLETRDEAKWTAIVMPHYHTAGAAKSLRRACFEQIGGFVPSRGWDTVDEIRAITRGWKTRHFTELQMKHWKPEGSGIGPLRTSVMHGEVYYLTGGGQLFFALKVLRRLAGRPFVAGGFALLWGYLRAALQRKPRLVTREESRCYRALLNERLFGWLRRPA